MMISSRMIFTGDVSPSFIDIYCKSISTLMELYTTEYADNAALFVNTMGWVEGKFQLKTVSIKFIT